ncbi:lymphocyte antigen 6G6e-like [Microcebus murinus]|uniref:lymphocyte antigen 6G6e-like n=1 Tax=Microcebus murinus TaxID=30608 RepID=UPI003F6C7F87
MGTSSILLCILLLLGALGVTTTSPAQGRLHCYTCIFAKPRYPAPMECQEDEICGVSIGTSDQSEVIERKGCLPMGQCPLLGHATYWSRACVPWHHCCEQDLCNVTVLDSSTITMALETPARTLLRHAQEPDFVWRPQIPGPNIFADPAPDLNLMGTAPTPTGTYPESSLIRTPILCLF